MILNRSSTFLYLTVATGAYSVHVHKSAQWLLYCGVTMCYIAISQHQHKTFLNFSPVIILMSTEPDNLKEIKEDNQMASKNEEPVMCSKCNITFESEEKYLQHYDEVHKPEIS
jgi:uncharacterized C2H2 Zn-finger protein